MYGCLLNIVISHIMQQQTASLVFATNNAHKLSEIRAIFGDKLNILSLADINCHDDMPETADTLEGNALIKARWVKERYGYDCFADDTGLEVTALGVHQVCTRHVMPIPTATTPRLTLPNCWQPCQMPTTARHSSAQP